MTGYWLIKIQKFRKSAKLTVLTYENYRSAIETAIAVRTAEKCGNVNRVVS